MSIFQEIKAGLDKVNGAFATNSEQAQLIATLETANKDLTAKLAASESKVALADSTVADLTAKLTKAETDLTASAAKITALEAEKKTVGEEAAQVVAALGMDTTSIPAQSAKDDAKTITRAQFEAMNHAERSAHFAAGGKIKD